MLSGDQLADLGRYCAQIHWLCGICCLLLGGFCLSSLNLRLFLLGQPWTWFWTWRKIPGPYSNRCADFHSVLRQYINTKSMQGFLPNLEIRFLLSSSFRYLTKYSKTMIEYKAFSLFPPSHLQPAALRRPESWKFDYIFSNFKSYNLSIGRHYIRKALKIRRYTVLS